MESPQTITQRPVLPDTAREKCERIYSDWRESTMSQVELMMFAYHQGRLDAFTEAKEFTTHTPPPKAETDDRSIMDVARELKQACDHFDAVGKDQYDMARSHNRRVRL